MKTLFNIGDKITAGDIASYIFDTIRPVAGYSLRKLSNISGPVIRARRSIDNKESDFYADEIEGGELQSFATGDGASDVFVTTWYDQFGNNNATQTSAANQPKIWDASTGLVTENGKPALDFDGSDDFIETGSVNFGGLVTMFIAAQSTSSYIVYYFDGQSNNNRFAVYSFIGNTTYEVFTTSNTGAVNIFNSTSKAAAGSNNLIYLLKNGSNSEFAENGGSPDTGTITSDDFIGITIGARFNNQFNYANKMREFIIYSSDQSANRETIETNISEYYVIYPMLYLKRITEDSGTFALTDRYELIYNQVSQVSTPSLLCTCDAYKGSSLTAYGTLYNIIPE